jgi:HAD superfamily hydrolase (TIGR01509 family)
VRRRRPPGAVLAALAVVALLLVGCRAQIDVEVVVDDDGSGEVTATLALDPDAADQLLDLRAGLPLEDLSQAGWWIEPPAVGEDGWTRIQATKEFGTPAQLSEIFDELDGPEGVFRSIELQRTRTFARVDYRLSGVLDPTGGFDQFADPELTEALGASVGEVADQLDAAPADVSVMLRVDLPGDLRESLVSGPTVPVANGRAWAVTLNDPAPVVVDASTTSRLVAPLVLRGVAVVAAVLAGLVLLGHALRLIRPESRRRPASTVRPRVAARASHPSRAAAAPTEGSPIVAPASAPRVVALDAMGVLYREGDDVRRLLIPFARQRGSLLSDDELIERARALSLGRITTAEFWSTAGVAGEAHELDREYLALHQLNPGVVRFLRALRERGIRAACVTNDAASWATTLRRRHSLDALIDLWVISGAVGVRKPDAPIFEALRRLARVPAAEIMVIDDDRTNLDAARAMGFRTAWFAPEGEVTDANGHAVLRSLAFAEDQRPATTEPAVQA